MTTFFSIPSILEPELNLILLIISSFVLIGICFRLIVSKNLIESILLMSAFSLVIAICYLFMDAPDVAMTETALGACLSTCVLLNLVKIIGDENFVLVYVKCDLETCEKRDVKGLYKKARNGEIKNFTGIDSDFEVPKHPDIIIDTKNNTIDDSVRQIYNYIKAKLKLN